MGARSKRARRIADSREFGTLVAELTEFTKECHQGLTFHGWGNRERLGSYFATSIEVNRDSDALAESNWHVITRSFLDDVNLVEQVTLERFAHWGHGWYERLYVRRDGAGALRALQGWLNALADYPVADEDHYSELEWSRNHPGRYPGECYCGNDDCPVPLRELPYVATINVPGYLPEGDPARFETAQEAWGHLAEERQRDEDEAGLEGDSYSQTVLDLEERANRTAAEGSGVARTGTVYGATPGYEGDHDLGLAYSVSWDGDH